MAEVAVEAVVGAAADFLLMAEPTTIHRLHRHIPLLRSKLELTL
jgi:hypothetical protein